MCEPLTSLFMRRIETYTLGRPMTYDPKQIQWTDYNKFTETELSNKIL